MPAESKSQQRIMGMAHAAQMGELDTNKMSPAFRAKVLGIAATMKPKDLKDMAETKHKGLPEKKAMVENSALKERYRAKGVRYRNKSSTPQSHKLIQKHLKVHAELLDYYKKHPIKNPPFMNSRQKFRDMDVAYREGYLGLEKKASVFSKLAETVLCKEAYAAGPVVTSSDLSY